MSCLPIFPGSYFNGGLTDRVITNNSLLIALRRDDTVPFIEAINYLT